MSLECVDILLMKIRAAVLTITTLLLAGASAEAASTSVTSKVRKTRAASNGSIYVFPVATTGCTDDRLFATTDKSHNEKILKVALAAQLADRDVKIQFDDTTCQIAWIEML